MSSSPRSRLASGIREPRGFLLGGRKPRRSSLLQVFALSVAALIAVPIVSIAVSLLAPFSDTWEHLKETVLSSYLLNSIYLAIGVGLGVTLLGVPTAWLVTLCRFPGQRYFEWALILPLAVPAYVMAYSYTEFFEYSGPVQTILRMATGWQASEYWFPPIYSLGGAMAMLVLVLYPYVYLLARAAFLEQSVCALEVSRTLGCGPFGSFIRVALPGARPAIAAGVGLAIMETLADFGTVSYFGVPTLTTGIHRAWMSLGDRVTAAQIATYLLVFVGFVIVLERLARGHARYHHASSRYRHLPAYRLRGWRAVGACLACFLPLFFGFLLPAILLIDLSVEADGGIFGQRYLALVTNSFSLAGLTAVLAVVIAVLMAYAARLDPGLVPRAANRVAAIGYAVPGLVIAVGVLIPFAKLDNLLDNWAQASFGISTGLLLTGSVAALVFAYLVRFLAVAINTVEASLMKIRPNMDDAARNLGQRPLGSLLHVHAPIMWGSLLTAALIVFVDVMKELPATLVMRPFNFDTLAVQAHNLAADERLNEAAVPSLTIVLVGILPLIVLSRTIARSRPGLPASDV